MCVKRGWWLLSATAEHHELLFHLQPCTTFLLTAPPFRPQPDGDVASPAAISMALSEPLGSGLFVGNIVFGLVMIMSGVRQVRVGGGGGGGGGGATTCLDCWSCSWGCGR